MCRIRARATSSILFRDADFPRIPAHMIVDEAGRRRYPLGNPTYNDRTVNFAGAGTI